MSKSNLGPEGRPTCVYSTLRPVLRTYLISETHNTGLPARAIDGRSFGPQVKTRMQLESHNSVDERSCVPDFHLFCSARSWNSKSTSAAYSTTELCVLLSNLYFPLRSLRPSV